MDPTPNGTMFTGADPLGQKSGVAALVKHGKKEWCPIGSYSNRAVGIHSHLRGLTVIGVYGGQQPAINDPLKKWIDSLTTKFTGPTTFFILFYFKSYHIK